jgi:hypothetical protein
MFERAVIENKFGYFGPSTVQVVVGKNEAVPGGLNRVFVRSRLEIMGRGSWSMAICTWELSGFRV